MNIPIDERVSLDEHSRGGQSDCARALAEAEKVLRELALFTRRSKPEHSNPANKARKVPALVPALSPIDRVVLDRDLDFIFHKDGTIELTAVGFRRRRKPLPVTTAKLPGALIEARVTWLPRALGQQRRDTIIEAQCTDMEVRAIT
jgi:hypothetical protein